MGQVMTRSPPPDDREILEHLRLYLSNRLPSQHLAGFLPRLAARPPESVARAIREWAVQETSLPGFVDRLSLGLHRFLVLRTRAGEGEGHDAFVRAVADALKAQAPPEKHEQRGRSAAPRAGVGPAAPQPGATAARAEPAAATRRLTRILDRLDAAPAAATHPSRAGLVGEAVLTAALAATSSEALETSLEDLRRRRLVQDTAQVLRVLVDSLPPWPLPDLTARTAPAARAIERLVELAPDPEQRERRFRDLVEAGVETFNRGTLERAEIVFGLAERLLDRGVVDAESVEGLRASGHERLDLEVLRQLLEAGGAREMPGTILRFYRVFDPEALLDKLRREPARRRRRLLLALLEAHRGEGRLAAFERLRRRPADRFDVFLLRNLVHLLRRIPDERSPWMPQHELARVVRLLVPENPPFLVREVLAYLSEKPHPVAEQVLVAFLKTLEEGLGLPADRLGDAGRTQWTCHLDDLTAALARYGTPRAWGALVAHGLKKEPELGETAARLAGLGSRDLSAEPDLVAQIVAEARAALPPGVLARPTVEQSRRLEHLLTALGGTRAGEVQELLETLAERFPDEGIGQRAARALTPEGTAAGSSGFDTPVGTSLSGDLRVFGLPTLLQNLADSKVTGALRLFDQAGRRAAGLEFRRGRLASARYGRLNGPEAVYQLLERPFEGSFGFVPRKAKDEDDETPRPEVPEVLLEGFRRHDELKRAAVLVPDDARLDATDVPPRAVPGEEDIDLVASLWQMVVVGTSAEGCEQTLAADAYRIRRCLAHWVEEGSLRLSPEPALPVGRSGSEG
jgi:hypothetical protein